MPQEQHPPTQADTSCERCKRRKSRCNRALPSCDRCTHDESACVYQTRRRPGFSTGHRQGLESRISTLEAENLQLRARLSQTPERAPTPEGKTDNVFQATYARTSTIVDKEPPLDLVISSVAIFLRHIHPWFPILDSQRLLSELVTTKEPSLLLHAIFGASLPFFRDPRLDQTTSDSYWKYIKRRIVVETTEEPSYASLEACTILALDISGMTNGPQVWSRLAIVAKLATLLQSPGGQVLRPSVGVALESRPGPKHHARLFWAVYALESLVSMTTGQAPLLTDAHVESFRSTRASTWNDLPNEQSSLFLLQLELVDISREIHAAYRGLSDGIELQELSRKPIDWLERQSLPLSGLSTPSLVIMNRAYSHALSIFANDLGDLDHPQSSVREIVELCNQFVLTKGDQLGWPFAWSIWTAARTLVSLAFQQSDPLPPEFYVLLESQSRMGRYWQVSKKYWRLLSRASEDLRDGGSSLLSAVANLRVPTSDLEDQFRVDPVLWPTEPSQNHATTVAADLVEEPHMFPYDPAFDTWFAFPLAASSASQPFSGPIEEIDWDGNI